MAGRGHRHERLEPGVLEPVPVLVVGEASLGEDRCGGRGIPRSHEVFELAFRHLDHTGHIPRGDAGRGVERREQRVCIPVVARLGLQRGQRPLHRARVGLEHDRVRDVFKHLERQIIETGRQVGDARGHLRPVGGDIDVDRPAFERRQGRPRAVCEQRIAVHEQRRQPRQLRDARGYGRQQVGSHVEPRQPSERGERGEAGVGEANVHHRQRREAGEAGQRPKRREPLRHGGMITRNQFERLKRREARDAGEIADSVPIDGERRQWRRLGEHRRCEPRIPVERQRLADSCGQFGVVEHHSLHVAAHASHVAPNRATHIEQPGRYKRLARV